MGDSLIMNIGILVMFGTLWQFTTPILITTMVHQLKPNRTVSSNINTFDSTRAVLKSAYRRKKKMFDDTTS